jgi:hypothetical protein
VNRRVVAFSATSEVALLGPATPSRFTWTVPAAVPSVFQISLSENGAATK